jgi:cbb3-type cytochrome c oxidase subunit III
MGRIVESASFAPTKNQLTMKLASLVFAAALVASSVPAFAAESAPEPAAAAPAAAKPDLNAGGTKFGATCAACHGADGNSGIPANPKLAQQHPEYIMKQLGDFKSGKRTSAIMQAMAAPLTDADIRNIAYWAGSQKAKPGFAKDKELVQLGEKIYRGGVQSKSVPACAGCHSPNGAGIPTQYPRLSGQHADYTVTQLTNFQNGTRKNSVPMADIASKLSDKEIKAVADYIAGLR